MTSGLTLKLERTARRAKGMDVARAMNVTSSYISAIEARQVISDDVAARYRAALATLPTIPTSHPLDLETVA